MAGAENEATEHDVRHGNIQPYTYSSVLYLQCLHLLTCVFGSGPGFHWVGGSGSGLGILIRIQAGQNWLPKRGKIKKFIFDVLKRWIRIRTRILKKEIPNWPLDLLSFRKRLVENIYVFKGQCYRWNCPGFSPIFLRQWNIRGGRWSSVK